MSLKRSTQNVMIAGVCAGIAHELDWPVERTRLGYVLLSVFSAAFPGILVYVVLWFVMPKTEEW